MTNPTDPLAEIREAAERESNVNYSSEFSGYDDMVTLLNAAPRLLTALDAVLAVHPRKRPSGNNVTPEMLDYCGGDHGGNPPLWIDCETVQAVHTALNGGEQ